MSTLHPDTRSGIAPPASFTPFTAHVVAGIHIGSMSDLRVGQYDAVLTVAAQPGRVAETLPHRHIPLNYQNLTRADLDTCVAWVLEQVAANRTVLVRSERGLQRPALVAAMAVLAMGGWFSDALPLVRGAHALALTDFRYLGLVRAEHDKLYAKKGTQ